MTRWRPWLAVIIVAAAAVGALLFIAPLAVERQDEVARFSPVAPPVRVEVRDGRLVLPVQAGEPALIYLALTNVSAGGMYLTEAALQGGNDTTLTYLRTPEAERASSLYIARGETLRLSPDTGYAIVSGYDSSVVPGTTATLQLTFENGEVIDVPLRVQSRVGQGGDTTLPGPPSTRAERTASVPD